MRKRRLLLVSTVALVLTGCAGSGAPTTPTDTTAATASASPSPTLLTHDDIETELEGACSAVITELDLDVGEFMKIRDRENQLLVLKRIASVVSRTRSTLESDSPHVPDADRAKFHAVANAVKQLDRAMPGIVSAYKTYTPERFNAAIRRLETALANLVAVGKRFHIVNCATRPRPIG